MKTGSECDYEGTLWAALALDLAGRDITPFIPYLVAMSSDKEQFLPSAFLYKLTQGQDHYSSLVALQRQNQYWQATGTLYNKFYDSALALFGLQGASAPELSNAKNYFLSIQSARGCWNNDNIRDTAFLLYAGWPDETVRSTQTNGSGQTIESCESASSAYSCEASSYECGAAGGGYLRQ